MVPEGAARPPIETGLAAAGLPPLPRTAWLELDLDALRANLALLRGLAGPGIPVRAVVKADAYGHGAVPIARALEAAGVEGFCVAAFDEAMDLRAGGVQAPILVLYPVPAVWAGEAARNGIALTSGDLDHLAALIAASEAGRGGPAPLARLEVETGLGRGGLAVGDVAAAARLVAASPASAGRAVDPPPGGRGPGRHRRAGRALRGRPARCEEAGVTLPSRHVAASAGLVTGDVEPTTASGPGLALHGLVPDELDPAMPRRRGRLRPVMALRARAARVADLPAGWGISYGPTFTTSRPSRIATLLSVRRRLVRASPTGRAHWSAGSASRSSGTWRWTRSWPT